MKDVEKRQESIEDIVQELMVGCPCKNMCEYLNELAPRIEAAHAMGVIKAMDDLMRG